ncbi:MAG TPA: methyl-accepting chemotaxis protein [Rhodanobacter sp.]|nr:methyl-accepting chemotaxis protein [Rhodanobacter sp.]
MHEADQQQGLLARYEVMYDAYRSHADPSFHRIFDQYLSWDLTFIGDYPAASAMFSIKQTVLPGDRASPLSIPDYDARPALEVIPELARNYRAVFFNEAHNVPLTRTLVACRSSAIRRRAICTGGPASTGGSADHPCPPASQRQPADDRLPGGGGQDRRRRPQRTVAGGPSRRRGPAAAGHQWHQRGAGRRGRQRAPGQRQHPCRHRPDRGRHVRPFQPHPEPGCIAEQTASAMEEMTTTVRQNADNAAQADQLVGSAARLAQQGGEIVERVVSTMGDIKASSRRIEDIAGMIDEIAFQTNILALNAAVEAARAGEHGRGFSVVASEVRSLAQRAAVAAKEIKELIAASVDTVDIGAKLVDSAGETTRKIAVAIEKSALLMSQISAASAEQSKGIEEISAAVEHMDETTQSNAALVEQSEAAARSLREQAERMSRAVATFKTADQVTFAVA